MNTPTRIAAFVTGLLAAFVSAAGIGNAVGPVGTAEQTAVHGGHESEPGTSAVAVAGGPLPGLAATQDGYLLDLATSTLPVGRPTSFAFRILGPDGQAVTRYSRTHDKDLHLIVVRRDTTGFQHLHPHRDEHGQWRVPLTLPAAGAYKVFADFTPDRRTKALTLAADINVAGQYEPQPLPAAARTATVDGYTVSLVGNLVPGQESKLTLRVSNDSVPVHDLQPYLAAYGHLVALRTSDLAYLHVHPDGEPGDGRTQPGPDITFYALVPSEGSYRLFLDFQHGGVVHTAEFTATASGAGSPVRPGDATSGGITPSAKPHNH